MSSGKGVRTEWRRPMEVGEIRSDVDSSTALRALGMTGSWARLGSIKSGVRAFCGMTGMGPSGVVRLPCLRGGPSS